MSNRMDRKRAYLSRVEQQRRYEKTEQFRKKQQLIYEIKASTPCKKCGVGNRHIQLTFHHVDETTKLANVSDMARSPNYSYEELWREIQKCQLLCELCHRIIHGHNKKKVRETVETHGHR
jgi:hypothetical protein